MPAWIFGLQQGGLSHESAVYALVSGRYNRSGNNPLRMKGHHVQHPRSPDRCSCPITSFQYETTDPGSVPLALSQT